ncbi:hypothetical protein V2J09_004346 [Rumex salicifolius]
MAPVSVDPAKGTGERLTVDSIPVIDLRFLTQSELTSLSRCSLHAVDLSHCDDLVIPKIDRSVFNESAGSRKQTYSRFRLSRRKPGFSAKPLPLAPAPDDDPERLHNSKIIALFKKLFNGDSQISPLTVDFSDSLAGDGVETPRRKRGRKPKTENPASEGEGQELVLYDNYVGRERDKSTVNKYGVVIDLVELAKLDDPFAPEISRRTAGMVKDDELLGFLTRLDGQWGSRRKRRKIVDANEFGHVLPDGWKVLVGMKKKQGQCWLFCRRYISPTGRYFMSCKEVSSYLMSLSGFADVKQSPLGPCAEASRLDIQPLSVNADTNHRHYQKAASATPITFESDDHGEPLVKDGRVGLLQGVGPLKCHKCSTSFNEKNHLLHHLLSCHKRKRRKAGMPMEDDELIIEGHYECQFCNKRFTERVCFFGHVGIHVKNYMKGIEGSPGVNTIQNDDVSISTSGIPPPALFEKSGSVEANADSVLFTPDIAAGNDPNLDLPCVKLRTESDYKGALSGAHETNLSSLGGHISRNSGAEKIVGEKSTEKGDTVSELLDKEVGGPDTCTDTADLKLNSCSEYENARLSDSKNDTRQTSIQDKAADDISCSKLQVQNTDGFVYEVEKSEELLNVHGFCNEVADSQEKMIAESELLGNDKSKSVNANTSAMLAKDNVGEPYNTELKDSFVDLFGSGNSDFGEKMDVISEAHQDRILASSSVVPHGNVDTTLPAFLSGRQSEQCSSAQDNMQRCVNEVDAEIVSISTSIGMNLRTSDYMKNDVPFGAASFNTSRRDAHNVFVLPGNVVSNVANTISSFRVLESGNIPFQAPTVVAREENPYDTESSSPCGTSSRSEPNSAEAVNSANFFNRKGSFDANPVANKVVNFSSSHLYSPIGSREAPNVFGICNSVIDTSKQTRDSESVLSSVSVGRHAHGMTGQIQDNRDNMNSNSSAPCATHLPDLGGSISDISSGVLPSFPPQTIATSPSPFSLWNDQSFGVEHGQSRVCDSSRAEVRGRVSDSSSLSLDSFQQTCNVGYNLNETYISTVDNFSRLNPLETQRDTDLMIGFRNLNARANQDAVSEALWRSNEGNAMPSVLGGSTSSQGQLPSAFQPFDFLSDKGENDIFSVNEKFDNMENFGGLRSSAVEPMEFSFLTPQDSNPQLGGPKVISYGNASGIEQGFESSVWLGKDTSMPNMNSTTSFSTSCVWCGSQFQLESTDTDAQAGSIAPKRIKA